jgi:hypothetical protein
MITFKPALAAVIAAPEPAGPAPIIKTSHSSILSLHSYSAHRTEIQAYLAVYAAFAAVYAMLRERKSRRWTNAHAPAAARAQVLPCFNHDYY